MKTLQAKRMDVDLSPTAKSELHTKAVNSLGVYMSALKRVEGNNAAIEELASVLVDVLGGSIPKLNQLIAYLQLTK